MRAWGTGVGVHISDQLCVGLGESRTGFLTPGNPCGLLPSPAAGKDLHHPPPTDGSGELESHTDPVITHVQNL
jgi:hypothetical protein